MSKRTIVEAAKMVLSEHPNGLTVEDIFNSIIIQNLYDFKAKNPYNVLLGQIRRQCYGIDFPSAYSIKHFKYAIIDGKTLYSILDMTAGDKVLKPNHVISNEEVSSDLLPEERIQIAHNEHAEALRKQLLDAILDESKTKMERAMFFEKLVIDLILRLGYGADADSGFTTGRSYDGGIDGIIHEDKLGLDKIYIQAKCNTQKAVDSKDVQAFVGAMMNIQKGIFVASSRFTKSAYKYAKEQQSKNIMLIDGDALTGLMVRHSVGLKEVKQLSIYKLDAEYFIGGNDQ